MNKLPIYTAILCSFLPVFQGTTFAGTEETPATATMQQETARSTYTPETAQAYLQAEKEIIALYFTAMEKSDKNAFSTLEGKVREFHKKYPVPLGGKGPLPEYETWHLDAMHQEVALAETLKEEPSIDELDEDDPAIQWLMSPASNTFFCMFDDRERSSLNALCTHESHLWTAYMDAPGEDSARAVLEAALQLGCEEAYFNAGDYRIGFLSVLFKNYGEGLTNLLPEPETLPGYVQESLARALWLAGVPEDAPGHAGELRRSIGALTPPDFHNLQNLGGEVPEAHLLDCAWGVYDASQDTEVLRSFILCGCREKAPENGYKFWLRTMEEIRAGKRQGIEDIVREAARWSVLSQAKRNPDFAKKVEAILEGLPAEDRERFNAPLKKHATSDYTSSPSM